MKPYVLYDTSDIIHLCGFVLAPIAEWWRDCCESHERGVDRSTEQLANFLASCDEVSLHDQIMLFADQNRDKYFSLYHIVNQGGIHLIYQCAEKRRVI